MRASRLVGMIFGLALVNGAASAQAPLPPPAVRTCENARPEQFGFNERPITGNKPLVVVLVEFTDAPIRAERGPDYYRRMLFGNPGPREPATIQSMFGAASSGRFNFQEPRIVRVSFGGPRSSIPREIERYDARVSTLMTAALRSQGVQIGSYDANRDRVVDDSELSVLRIAYTPGAPGGGQSRWHQASVGDYLMWRGNTANVDVESDINTVAHELFHTLGFPDHIYGPGASLNFRASFMAAAINVADSPGAVPLDPHHRMRAGWLRPTMADVTGMGGSARIGLYGTGSDNTTVLFYSRTRCDELFIAEPHNTGETRVNIERGAAGNGVMLWYVKLNGRAGYAPYQFNWPPPIRTPYSDTGAGNHAIANYVIGRNRPGEPSVYNWNDQELTPVWGDGTPAGFGIEVAQTQSLTPNYVGWRRTGSRYAARIDAINGVRTALTVPNQAGTEIVVTGMFPARTDGIRVELINFTQRVRVSAEITPERVTIRLREPVPAGAYQIHLVRDAPREIQMRGQQQVVTFR